MKCLEISLNLLQWSKLNIQSHLSKLLKWTAVTAKNQNILKHKWFYFYNQLFPTTITERSRHKINSHFIWKTARALYLIKRPYNGFINVTHDCYMRTVKTKRCLHTYPKIWISNNISGAKWTCKYSVHINF